MTLWACLSTDERAAAIRAGVRADKSAHTIGWALGVSKNVIIGWARRNGVKLRASVMPGFGQERYVPPRKVRSQRPGKEGVAVEKESPAGKEGEDASRPEEAVRVPPVTPPRAPPGVTRGPVLFADRRMGFECAWIDGDSRLPGVMCCGEPVVAGGSWCAVHWKRAHGPGPPAPRIRVSNAVAVA